MSIRTFFSHVGQCPNQTFCTVLLAMFAAVWLVRPTMGREEQRQREVAIEARETQRQDPSSPQLLDVQQAVEQARRMALQSQHLMTDQKDHQQQQLHALREQLQHLEGQNRELTEVINRIRADRVESEQLRKIRAHRAPIEGGQVLAFRLQEIGVEAIADMLLEFYGPDQLRIAPDHEHNRIVIFAKEDLVKDIHQFVKQLDVPSDSEEYASEGDNNGETKSLMVRMFWLADGLPKGEGSPAMEYLPQSVRAAFGRLGLHGPRLISQNSVSLAIGPEEEGSEFHFNFPAVVHGTPLRFMSHGELVLDGQPRLDVNVEISGQFELSGRLTAPLGHYMVLGTANYVASGLGRRRMLGLGGGMGRGGEGGYGGEGGGAGGMGYGGEVGGEGEVGYGGEGGYGEGGYGGEGSAIQPKPKLSTSRFVFVVQVIEAKSFAPE